MMTAGRGARGPQGHLSGENGQSVRHIPVLLNEVLEAIKPADGGVYLDGTFGAGGYSSAILETAGTKVLAVDRDPDAIEAGQRLAEKHQGRLTLLHGPFSAMVDLAAEDGVTQVDGVMLDLGVSSMQLDEAERGFSFMQDGPLDMRMAKEGPSAADIVNEMGEADLANILFILGEEKRSRAIAKAIAAERKKSPIETTGRLADIISGVLGRAPTQKIHPATRSFQALRLYVNSELEEVAEGLYAAEKLLKPDGILAVVTFHSLEDRIVKRFFQLRSGKTARPSRHMPDLGESGPKPTFELLYRRPVTPSDQEIAKNPRARSAKLRAGIRTSQQPTGADMSALGLPRLP